MKQTQTHVWSLAGEEAVSYSLARGKAAAVTRESGEIAASLWRHGASILSPRAPNTNDERSEKPELARRQPRLQLQGRLVFALLPLQ